MKPRFATPVFLGSALLFCIEPMLGRTLLPHFGGTASVWTICLVAYQLLLLAGAVYADRVSRARGGFQRRIHLALLAVAAAWVLAFALLRHRLGDVVPASGEAWKESGCALLCVLAAIGLPFTVLSAGSSLIQKWASEQGGGRETYRLYAVSNIGSFVGLLLYPFVLEPFVSQNWQWLGYAIGFAIYLGLCASAARWPRVSTPRPACNDDVRNGFEKPSLPTIALWLALPALSTMVLNSTTTHLSTDVSPFPLMWVVLLGAFLLSYSIGFSRTGERLLPVWLVFAVAAACYAIRSMTGVGGGDSLNVFAHNFASGVALVFFGGCFLHSWLCRTRPGAGRLTAYYLCISLGGAAGGFLSGILPALVFDTVAEFPISVFLTVAAALLALATALGPDLLKLARFLKPGFAFNSRYVGILFAVSLLATAFAIARRNRPIYATVYDRSRNFYGCLLVARCYVMPQVAAPRSSAQPRYPVTILHHGNTAHGLEPETEEMRFGATAYYGPTGGGLAFSLHPSYSTSKPLSVAIVGMGAGTQAWYGRKGDRIRYYEINPAVVDAANRHFTFLRKCKAEVSVVVADARKALEEETRRNDGKYDVLVVDAYSGDSVPFHLITRQAFELYASRIKDDGIIALHISNWHIDLYPVCKAAARHLGLRALGTKGESGLFTWGASWVFLSRRELTPPPKGVVVKNWDDVRDIPLPDDEKGSILPYVHFRR